jgi:two-component system, LytTR family, response regulator
MKLNVLIVDDEQPSRDNLQAIIDNYFEDLNIVGQADSVDSAFEAISRYNPDLVFLDIEMGASNGLDLVGRFPDADFEVIFITAYEEYAVKAFRTKATDYILKPIDIDDLRDAILKVEEKMKSKQSKALQAQLAEAAEALVTPKFIKISTNEGTELVPHSEIIYLKSINYYTNIVLSDGREIITTKILKEYEVQLKSASFFRIHNSYIINLMYLKGVVSKGSYVAKLSNDVKISISRRRKDEFLKFLELNQINFTEF